MATKDCLLVIVPGIGGSVLADSSGIVWGDSLGRLVGRLATPERLSLDEAPSLTAVGLVPDVGYRAPFLVPGYSTLVEHVQQLAARNRRLKILQFPYDFRLGVVHAADQLEAAIADELADVPPSDRTEMVVVVGHSMGGLVARHWLCRPGQAALCRLLITVGTPHRGAPKVLDWLVNGPSFGQSAALQSITGRLRSRLQDVLRGWPALYDLAPTYEVVELADGRHIAPRELGDVVSGGFLAGSTFGSELARAARVHADITTTWEAMENPPLMAALFARNHGTTHRLQLEHNRLGATQDDPWWQPNPGWRGDGTVPAISAIPPDLADAQHLWHTARDRHGPMASGSGLRDLLSAVAGESLRAVRGTGPTTEPQLGIDLPDAMLLGEAIEIRARVVGVNQDELNGAKVKVQLQDQSGDQPLRFTMERTGDAWMALAVPPRAGIWHVRVQAVGTPNTENLIVSDHVAVIDETEL